MRETKTQKGVSKMRMNAKQRQVAKKYLAELAMNCTKIRSKWPTNGDDLERATLYFLEKCQNLILANEQTLLNLGDWKKVVTISPLPTAFENAVLEMALDATETIDFNELTPEEKEEYVSLMTFFSDFAKKPDNKEWRKLEKELEEMKK